jgi:hypothetical protein
MRFKKGRVGTDTPVLGLVPSNGAPRKAPIGSVNPSGGSKVRKVGRADRCPVQSLRTPGSRYGRGLNTSIGPVFKRPSSRSGCWDVQRRGRSNAPPSIAASLFEGQHLTCGRHGWRLAASDVPVATQPAEAVEAVVRTGGDESDDDEAPLTVNEAKTKLKNARKAPRLPCLRVWTISQDGHWCLGASPSEKM